MRDSVKILSLFITFVFIFSSLAACSKTADTQISNGNAANSTQTAVSNSTGTSPAKNDFPEVPASIAQASLETVDGEKFTLADKKGKVVLVNLWGIWCVPCKKEMPHLIELQDKYRDQNFEIIGLNVGDENAEKETADKIKSFAETMKLNYTLAWADDQVYMDFLKLSKFPGVPQSFLIDRDGRLNGVFLGGGPKTVENIKDNVGKLMNPG